MATSRSRWVLVPALVLMVFALAGCAQDAVSNQTDAFSYGGQVAGKSGTRNYTWKVTGKNVQVNWGGQTSSGTLDLTLKDGAGAQVYAHTFGGTSQGGASDSLSNVRTGDWTVTLAFHSFTGQMGLSLSASGGYCPTGVPYC